MALSSLLSVERGPFGYARGRESRSRIPTDGPHESAGAPILGGEHGHGCVHMRAYVTPARYGNGARERPRRPERRDWLLFPLATQSGPQRPSSCP